MSRSPAILASATVLLGMSTSVLGQFYDFATDLPGASPGIRAGGFGYSGFGYSAVGPRGTGYYVGLPDHAAGNGPSGYFSPVFNAMAAAPPGGVRLGPTFGGYGASRPPFPPHVRVAPGTVGFPAAPVYGAPPTPHGSAYHSAYVAPGSQTVGGPERRGLGRIFGR